MNNIRQIELIYQLTQVKGIGSVQINRFLLSLREEIDNSELEENMINFLSYSQKNQFLKSDFSLDYKENVGFISILNEHYPKDLKLHLSTRTPPVLSYIGNINLLKKKRVGISGSRKVSSKGISIAADCVSQLAQRDICIISGYATGVDQIAHYTAITEGASTIIILPEGINSFRIKKELESIWDWSKILVLSEFIPSDKWSVGRAMLRNNTIIGLSDIMIIVEAGEIGGSFDAGLSSIKKGKYVFVPRYVTPPESALGNDLLINKGAFPILMKKDTQKANLNKVFEILEEQDKYSLFSM